MLGLLTYGFFLVVLPALMRVASVRSMSERANAAAAMLSVRVS
jgi:hypothetical protein